MNVRDSVAVRRPLRWRWATGALVPVVMVLGAACSSSSSTPAATPAAAPVASSPAADEPNEFAGTFHLTYYDGDTRTWTAVSCGPGCADVQQEMEGNTPTTVAGRARLQGTRWKLSIRRPDAIVCPDGSEHAGMSIWTWDAETLVGGMNVEQFRDDCNDGMAKTPDDAFTLTRDGDPLPEPGMRSS